MWADRLARSRSLPERGEELGERHAESRGQPTERADPDVPLTAFNAADVVSMKVRACSEFFL